MHLRALPQPSHQTARALPFQPSPAWGHLLPALPGVSSESPGQVGWWVTLFAPVAQPCPHLPVGSSGGPSRKDQFSAIPAPTRRVGVWVRVHDMSGTPSEKVRRGFQALRSLKAQDVLSPPHRTVEVPVQGDPPGSLTARQLPSEVWERAHVVQRLAVFLTTLSSLTLCT